MVLLAVNGTLMRGLELNGNLVAAGASFVREAVTAPEYRLFSVRDAHPGMLRVAPGQPLGCESAELSGGQQPQGQLEEAYCPGQLSGAGCPRQLSSHLSQTGGRSIALEVWEVPEVGLMSVVQREPAGLCVGKVSVVSEEDGGAREEVLGVLAEPWAVAGMLDITEFGGWRAYVQARDSNSLKPTPVGLCARGSNSLESQRLPSQKALIPGSEILAQGCGDRGGGGPEPLGWLQEGIGKGPRGPGQVQAMPYDWPFDGKLTSANTALLVIDMQVDFCGNGGYVDQMGYDISLTRAPIEPIRGVLQACRAAGVRVIHTREGHRPDLSDLPLNKKWRSEQIGAGIGSEGPNGRVLVSGEQGWDIISELSPLAGEPVVDKPGKGSFFATDLEFLLNRRGVRNLILTGITTDVCVHTTMRDANDRGYECLLLADCTGATDWGNHEAALKMVTMQGGVFGAVTFSKQLADVVSTLPLRL